MGLTFGILRSWTSQDCYDEMMTPQASRDAITLLFKSKMGVQAETDSLSSAF
jgi:hypothetical protein